MKFNFSKDRSAMPILLFNHCPVLGLFEDYSKVIRRLFEDYSKIIRIELNNLRLTFE
jgi:hypothetical protein